MHDRPTKKELLAAVRKFLEADAVEALEGGLRFHARIAANVLAIVERELDEDPAAVERERDEIEALLGSPAPPGMDAATAVRERTAELCRRIRDGEARGGPWREAVLRHVRATVRRKLEVAAPKRL